MVPCYVVNLDSDTKKWEKVTRTLTSIGIKHERFPAVYGKSQSPEYIKEITYPSVYYNLKKGRAVDQDIPSLGAIGCYLSHVGVWKKFLESGEEKCLVFEDDLDSVSSLAEIQAFVQEVPEDWDFIFLGYQKEASLDEDVPLGNCYKIKSLTFMTHAYLITKRGATTLLKSAFPIFCQIDSHISYNAIRGDINAYRPVKSMFKQTFTLSSACQEGFPVLKLSIARYSNRTITILILVFFVLLLSRLISFVKTCTSKLISNR
jgi:GR25 family glycosyltransferase involved in LPS biosynthesis